MTANYPAPWHIDDVFQDEGGLTFIETAEGDIVTSIDNLETGRLISASPEMRDCLEATLLWFAGGPWTAERHARWQVLTGASEATSKALCDTIRRALQKARTGSDPLGTCGRVPVNDG